ETVCEPDNGPYGPSLQLIRRAFARTKEWNEASFSRGANTPRLSWPERGETPPPRLAARLLRGSRTGGRDGRARARPLRSAGLRPQADRPQLPRRRGPARPRGRLRRRAYGRARRRDRGLLGPR